MPSKTIVSAVRKTSHLWYAPQRPSSSVRPAFTGRFENGMSLFVRPWERSLLHRLGQRLSFLHNVHGEDPGRFTLLVFRVVRYGRGNLEAFSSLETRSGLPLHFDRNRTG